MGTDFLFTAYFKLCVPGADVAAHIGMVTVAIAGLMGIGKNIPAFVVAGLYLRIERMRIITAACIIQYCTLLPYCGLTVQQNSAAGTCSVDTAGRPFDNLD